MLTVTDGAGSQPQAWYVIASHKDHADKSNVMLAIDTNVGGTVDTTAIAYESNGDISTYVLTLANITRWVRLPFASQTSGATIYDTTTDPRQYYSTIAAGAGSTSDVVDGTTLTTQLVTLTQTLSDSVGLRSTTIEHFRYAPSIGLIVSDTTFGAMSTRLIKYSVHN